MYIAFASHNDLNAYHGWVMGYDATSLQQKSIWNYNSERPQGRYLDGGLRPIGRFQRKYLRRNREWKFHVNTGGKNYGDSVVKLTPSASGNGRRLLHPFNQADLTTGDIDLGSTGFVLLADQSGANAHIGVVAGKKGPSICQSRRHGRIHMAPMTVWPCKLFLMLLAQPQMAEI